MHTCPYLTPRPGNWLGAAEPCYSTHVHTRTHNHTHTRPNTHARAGSNFLEPGYLPVHQDERCKPSTGMKTAQRSNLSNITYIPLFCLSVHLSVFFLSLPLTVFPLSHVSLPVLFLLLAHTERLHGFTAFFLPAPPFLPPG